MLYVIFDAVYQNIKSPTMVEPWRGLGEGMIENLASFFSGVFHHGDLLGDEGFEADLFFSRKDRGLFSKSLLRTFESCLNRICVDFRCFERRIGDEEDVVGIHLKESTADEETFGFSLLGVVDEFTVGYGGNQISVAGQHFHLALRGRQLDAADFQIECCSQGGDDFEVHGQQDNQDFSTVSMPPFM